MRREIAIILLGLFILSIPTIGFAKGDTLQKKGIPFERETKKHAKGGEILPLIKPNSVEDSLEKSSILSYEVVKGDTLYALAQKYDTTVEQIKQRNELDSSLIIIGQTLRIEKNNKDKVKQAKVSQTKSVSTEQDEQPEGKTMTVTATAYTAECDGCSGITFTGVNLLQDREAKVIAVDPDVIPLGTEVYVEGYGYAVAEDIGGAIKGNRIDIHVPTKEEAFNWGVRDVTITIIEE